MTMSLYDHIGIRRRYTRSVQLERDLEIADSMNGYILTPNAKELMFRFFDALMQPNSVRAWTLTGVYGTGKSAFAHFLTALCSANNEMIKSNAIAILGDPKGKATRAIKGMGDRGLIRAVATAYKEPISHTIVRALKNGGKKFWEGARGPRPAVLRDIESLSKRVVDGKEVDNKQVLTLLRELSIASKSGLLVIIDELGKNLEFSAQNQGASDLYILQQIAELPSGSSYPRVFFIGLLHQAFYEYSHGLAMTSRSEWAKIQGRFEDISFSESPDRLLYLIKNAIEFSDSGELAAKIEKWAHKWKSALKSQDIIDRSALEDISALYPFNPVAAVALPVLCNKFSQNDRTLFTFLSSEEPHSFKNFLRLTEVSDANLITLKIDQLYDYFVESAGAALSSRPQYQRWLEIQGRISEAKDLDLDSIRALKVIGVLNLISNAGKLRASRKIVTLCLNDLPDEKSTSQLWDKAIDLLIKKGFVTWRKQYDELRIWQGSDFDIELAMAEHDHIRKTPLSELLNNVHPLTPLIARRHSYETGTVRYFERQYIDEMPTSIEQLREDSDGIICYVTSGKQRSGKLPAVTKNGKPVVVITAEATEALQAACYEYVALLNISKTAKQLQSDGVARREVGQRLFEARTEMEDAVVRSFGIHKKKCYIAGARDVVSNEREFNAKLSLLCDEAYSKGPRLWNELINRRELTSQGAKARRELIEALINRNEVERLGMGGNGPEFSMYESLIKNTGIHKFDGTRWYIDQPYKESGIYAVWKAIEDFCLAATNTPRSVTEIYELIQKPPYGVKKGIIPVLILAVLLYHNEYLSIYFDGSYLPVLGADNFDLLVKRPERFTVKYFEITGLRAEIFKELEDIVTASVPNRKALRNVTVLSIVNPLVRFIRGLPQYTLQTDSINEEAKAVRKALLGAKDPDVLLFDDLPKACGLSFIDRNSSSDSRHIKTFRKKLVQALQELQMAYEEVLNNCKSLIAQGFSTSTDIKELRSYLRAIATRLTTNTRIMELTLKRFIGVSINPEVDDKAWLESLVMVVADKPVSSWTDNDALSFEIKFGETVRRFRNLESLIDLTSDNREGFEARKITVTYPTGEEINEIVWLGHKERAEVDQWVNKLFSGEIFRKNNKISRAILAALIERVFGLEKEETRGKGIDIIKKRGK
jgi:hypothetical protein